MTLLLAPGVDIDLAEADGACHCGAVRFHVKLLDGLRTARRCNCSFCRMRGAVAVSAALNGLTILSGGEHLALYQFNSNSARHHFCGRCGIYTHHQRRSKPGEYGVNVACLGISPFAFLAVPVLDGVHHPADGHPWGEAGTLRFKPGK